VACTRDALPSPLGSHANGCNTYCDCVTVPLPIQTGTMLSTEPTSNTLEQDSTALWVRCPLHALLSQWPGVQHSHSLSIQTGCGHTATPLHQWMHCPLHTLLPSWHDAPPQQVQSHHVPIHSSQCDAWCGSLSALLRIY